MVQIHPFRGIRYNEDHPSLPMRNGSLNLDDLITQPYDKISDEMQDHYYDLSQYNFVRLILNRGDADGDLPADRYEQARALLDRWTSEEVFVRDDQPGFYAYETRFVDGQGNERRRLGFYALAGLEGFGDGSVHAHEHTMSGPKADRLRLLRSTRSNLEPIFFLYEDDPKSELQNLLAETTRESPDLAARTRKGNEHRIWFVDDPERTERIQTLFQGRDVVIADGHHRYETALQYQQERTEQNDPAAEAAGRRMGVFISAEDPGLYIYPSHRVVSGLDGFDYQSFRASLEDRFDTRPYSLSLDSEENVDKQIESFLEDVRFEGIDDHAFGAVPGDEDELLLFQLPDDDIPRELFPPDRSDRWISLDVNLLSKLVLEERLNITPDDVEAGRYLSYHRHAEDVFERVRNGEGQIGFIMNATDVQEVLDVASDGERMPQKSTDFYPKLPSGLVFHRLEEEDHDG